MFEAPFVFAFTLGLVAAVNPCGFAMLPAYMAYFLGIEGTERETDRSAGFFRALATGGIVSLGFVVVFGITGILLSAGISGIRDVIPWISIVIGVALLILGLAMLRGFKLSLALPRMQRGGDSRTAKSLFLFGLSYGTTSLACALPLFLIPIGLAENFASGVAVTAVYSLGMSLAIIALTVSMALARGALLGPLQKIMKHQDRIAGIALVIAGGYTIFFWVEDIFRPAGEQSSLTRWVEELSASVTRWIGSIGGLQFGLRLVAFLALVAVAILIWPNAKTPESALETEEPEDSNEPSEASS